MNANRSRLESVIVNGISLRIPLLSHWRLVVAAAGIGLAALGQIVITSGRFFDWPIVRPLADAVFDMHLHPTAILVGVILLAAGGVAFAASLAAEGETDDLGGARPGLTGLGRQARRWGLFAGIITVGLSISSFVWLQLALGNYSDIYPFLWVFGIAVVGCAFFYLDRCSEVDLSLRIGIVEVGFLVIVIIAFVALNLWDLRSWYYTVIGDEYGIWQHARGIAEGQSPNFFSLKGDFGALPWAESYYRAGVMTVFGTDYFGWKFAGVLAGAAAFVPLYFLVRALFNVRTAVAATVLLVAAHVLLAYVHSGYDAPFGLFPSLLAFALFFSGMKRGSALLIFGAGAVAGLGFYVYPPARIVLPVILLVLLLYRSRVDLKRDLTILLFGFAMVLAPIILVNNTDIITLMTDQSIFNYGPTVPDPWEGIKDNIFRNPLAFNYNEKEQHFVSGSLLEPITAVLAVLGLAYALRRFKRPAFAFLLIWFAVAMAASGIASPHAFVPMIRMAYLIPIVVVFAAIALAKGYDMAQGSVGSNAFRTLVPALALAIILLASVGSNLYRFWDVTPHDVRADPDVVVMKAALSGECPGGSGQRVVVAPGAQGALALALLARDWGGDTPAILGYDEMERIRELSPVSCVIYRPDSEPPSAVDIARLKRLTGAQQVSSVYDLTGLTRVIIIK